MKLFIRLLSLFLILNTFYISRVEAQSTRDENKRWLNGFNLTNLLIPSNEIKHGGPPRDGIPAINQPKYAKADATDFLHDDDYVLGVYQNDIAKAYPIRILNYHEIVNDLFDETAIAITYCPLCGSGVAILADIDGTRFSFGVSGLLYNSDVLLYDRETESLWSQLMGKAVSGSQSGTELEFLPTDYTTWSEWKNRYPKTLVLTTETGYVRDYSRTPYVGYEESPRLMFPVKNTSDKLEPKERVLGIEINGAYKAYPLKNLKNGPATKEDVFKGKTLKIHYNVKANSARITDLEGKELPAITLFWFAWYAFHPDTEIYDSK